ncbi:hypothetical protein IQ250_19575 [Pseudanabaenaceae cyanobacterium LEGE 13415]|nr:hypothetical protein [Pseudanabaenaceae cyanobacterium LEGE 13415]
MSPIKKELLAAIEAAPDEAIEQTLQFLNTLLQETSPLRPGSGKSILRHAGKWQGDDFEECLQAVYDSRSDAEF